LDLSFSTRLTDFPSAEVLRQKTLTLAAQRAVGRQLRENPNSGTRVAVRPSTWRQLLFWRVTFTRVWPVLDTPFAGLLVGENFKFYQMALEGRPDVTVFETDACTPHDHDRIIEAVQEMARPTHW